MSSTGTSKRRTSDERIDEALKSGADAYLEESLALTGSSLIIQGGSAAYGSFVPGGSEIESSGDTFFGALAFNPVLAAVDAGRINISPNQSGASKNSSYVLVTGQGSPDEIFFIDGADKNGQILIYQGTETQIQTLKHANITSITSISGTGTVTVQTTTDHGYTTGLKVNIVSTINFTIQNVAITVTGADTFEYTATGNVTPESDGLVQPGNMVMPDGQDVILDATVASNGIPIAGFIFDPTVEAFGAWRLLFTSIQTGGGGISFPVIPPVSVRGSVGTNQNINLSLTTAHSTSMTLTASIDITFSGFPTTGNQIEWEIEITQDGTGGHVITWPAEVVNPPTLNTAAGTIVVIVFRTNDGGTTVRVGNTVTTTSTGGTGTLSGLVIDVTKDWQTFAITNLSAIQYVDTGAVVRGSISGDTGGPLRLATATGGSFVISDVITDIATFDNTTGLTIEGSHVINMGNNIINTISELQFSNANAHTPSNELSIAFDTNDDALKYSVALTTDVHMFFANTDLLATFSRVGTNEGLLSIQAVTAASLQATETLFLSTFNNTTPTNGDIWRDSGDGKFKFRQNGVTDEIGTQSSIVDGNSSATILDAAPSFVVVLDGTQKYSISNTRVDYEELDLFGITQINMNDSLATQIMSLSANISSLDLNIITATDTFDISFNSVDLVRFNNANTQFLSGTPNTTSAAIRLFRDDPSPAADDALGSVNFDGNNSAAEFTNYGRWIGAIENPTNGSEIGRATLRLLDDGLDTIALQMSQGSLTINKFSATPAEFVELNLEKEDTTPTAGDNVARLNMSINDSGVITTYARFQTIIQENTDATLFKIQIRSDNILQDAFTIEGNDNNTQFQYLMSSNGNTRIQPLSSAVMGYFVTSQVTDFSKNLGSAGTKEIPHASLGATPSDNDLNSAAGDFDNVLIFNDSDDKLYIRKTGATSWISSSVFT